MKKTLGVLLGLALASMARGQAIADYAQLISNFAVRLDSGSGVVSSGGVTGGTCTNQFVSAIDTSGVPTCASVSTATVSPSAITLAKIANAAANSIVLGSGAAGSGAAYSEITLGSGLSMTGTTLSSTGGGVADPGGNGIMARTALNTSINRTIVCAAAYCTWANGDGVAGAPSLTLSLTTTNDGGAIVKQASAPGTVQSTAFSNIDGLSTVTKANILLVRTPAFFASNTTASDGVNTVQLAPSYQACGSGWNSTSGLPETDCFRLTLKPITNAGTTTMTLGYDFSTNGGAYVTDRFLVAQNGSISMQGNVTLIGGNGNVTVPASGSGKFLFSSHGGWDDPGTDGLVQYETSGGTVATYVSGVVTSTQVAAGIFQVQAGSGAKSQYGSSTEAITLATGAVTTDSTNTLLPANSIIDGFVFRVTASITTATTIQFGDDTPQVARFSGALSATPCGAANIAINATGMCTQIFDPSNASLALGTANQTGRKVRITTNVNPGAGIVRVTVFWHVLTPPTS